MLFDRATPGADYEALHAVQDPASGLRAVIAVHSTRLGPAAGGIRRKRYPGEEAAVEDALRLASAMTLKCAMAELPAGGAKTVLLDHAALKVPEAYRALGRAIEALHGAYIAGPDVGTGDEEMAEVQAVTRHVNPPGSDTGLATAIGVAHAMRGTLRVLDGEGSPRGKSVVVQGLGSVGLHLVRLLRAEGAEVLACDLKPDLVAEAEGLGARRIAPEEALRTQCDVLAPCALGGVLTAEAARALPARAVCGSANNQLASPAAGEALHRRGIRYAPDFVVNAGGVIQGIVALRHGQGPEGRAEVHRRLEALGPRTEAVLRRAEREGVAPEAAAVAMAHERLRAGPR